MTYSTFFILSLLAVVQATNDWSKPCVTGVCSYDLPSTNGSTSSGTMKIWGSQTAIGDVTEAAGWKILGCSPDELTQDIRLVCMGGSLCEHLSSGHGAADTIVRLPENCGKGPLARVQKMWVPADQSIPASIAARIVRRDGSQPQVQAITLDTNFAAVNDTKTGAVNLAIKGANIPGVNQILDTDIPTSQRRSRHNARGVGSFVSDAADSISNAISSVNTVNVNKSKALPAQDFSKKVSLFDQSVNCPPISASVSADMDATAHAVVTIGIAASGTIVPPAITDFSLVASLTADLNGELSLTAELSGTVSTGSIKLFEAGIPGLDFPGILSVGPTFEVNAVGTATSEVKADLTLGLNYHVNNAQLFFPPNGKATGGTFSLGDTPLKLSADTKVEATTTVSAHLIPSINIGLSALDVATATVSLELDASASMVLKVEAGAGASATIQQANRKRQDDGSDDDSGSDDGSDDTDSDSDVDDSDDGSDDSSDDSFDDGSDDSDDADDGSDDTDEGLDDNSDDTTDDGLDDGSDDSTGVDSSSDSDSTDVSGNADPTEDGGDSTDDGSSADDSADDDSSADTPDSTDDADLTQDSSDSTDDADSTQDSSDSTDDTPDSTEDTSDNSTSTDDSDSSTDSDSTDSLDPSASASAADPSGTDDDSDSSDSDPTASASASAVDASSTDDGSDDDDSSSATLTASASAANATATDDGSDDANSTSASTTSASDSTATSAATTTSSAPLVSATTATETNFGGSVTFSGGLELSADATGSFFSIFSASKKISLFKKDFELFSKTFGGDAGSEGSDGDSTAVGSDSGDSSDSGSDSADTADDDSDSDSGDSDNDTRRSLTRRRFARRVSRAKRFALQRRDLQCIAKKEGDDGSTTDIADETVPGKDL